MFSDFVNSDDCIGKSHQNLSEYNQFLFKKRFEVDGEKMRNSGNLFYDYAHSFFGEDFLSDALYWYYI